MSTARLRSLLFVPGDSERKQLKALTCPADALILDLEDSVDPGRLGAAREQVKAFLALPPHPGQQRWVRVNGPASGLLLADLAALLAGGGRAPDGIVVPKVSAAAELSAAAHYLEALEAAHGHAAGTIGLIVIATETPQGLLALPRYPEKLIPAVRARLTGLTWGMEDLGAALGTRGQREPTVSGSASGRGALSLPFQLARATCLIAAAALGAAPIDGVYARFKDAEGLAQELAACVRDGFVAKLAIHPDQVEPINAAFTPSTGEIEHARAVVAAFAGNATGVVSLEGQMLDRPHLLAAQRVLAAAGQTK